MTALPAPRTRPRRARGSCPTHARDACCPPPVGLREPLPRAGTQRTGRGAIASKGMDAAQNAVEYLFATAAHLWCDQAKDKHSQTPTHAHGLNLSMAAVVQLDHKVRELSKCKEWATDAERRVMQVRSDLKTKRNEKNALPCFGTAKCSELRTAVHHLMRARAAARGARLEDHLGGPTLRWPLQVSGARPRAYPCRDACGPTECSGGHQSLTRTPPSHAQQQRSGARVRLV